MVGSKHLFNFVESRPDVEEGEKFIRRHNQSKCADQSLFLNFAMHSARVEACDCPPTNHAHHRSNQTLSYFLEETQLISWGRVIVLFKMKD